MKPGLLARYRDLLPVTGATPLISLGEGDTPLVRSGRLERRLGVGELYFKLEGCNPTGSFKDRGMVLAVAKALEVGSRTVVCASTGNTSASASAYAAHFGLEAIVIIPRGQIAKGKVAQALMYGAKVLAVEANFDGALEVVREICQKHAVTLVNSINPHRLQGQRTAAFELVDALGESPDYLFIPVGNAGNITAYWQGFRAYAEAGHADHLPRMMGFQAAGAAPIVRGRPVLQPQTIATAIRIGNPASWQSAVEASYQSGGAIEAVSDEEIVAAYCALGQEEGIFAEPASAASVAGLLKMVSGGLDLSDKRVVCVLTGNGLKDPDTALKVAPGWSEVGASLEAVERALGW